MIILKMEIYYEKMFIYPSLFNNFSSVFSKGYNHNL
ncbi:hypothetical protein DESC_730025 [Desulfosarcina cetonica]|nr:hypothetical protein DESC_730025 [Desulfosarcina cetonica]